MLLSLRLHLKQMSDRESTIFSRYDVKMPGIFGSNPFMFKRPTFERRLNEGALSATATESIVVVWRACCFFLRIFAHIDYAISMHISFNQGGWLQFVRRQR